MKRFLIIKLWALGDILMATPVLRALKREYPHCRISWMVEKSHAEALAGNPLVDDLIVFDLRAWRRQWNRGNLIGYLHTARRLRRDLKAKRFDVVLNLTPEKWWSVWFSIAPQRIGLFSLIQPQWLRRFYTHALFRSQGPMLHNTRHYLRAAEALGILGPYDERMVLAVLPDHRRTALDFLATQADYDPRKPVLIFHPGTSQSSKCWPPDLYAALAALLGRQYRIVITGSPQETPLADAILAALPPDTPRPLVATGQLMRLQHTAALIEHAVGVVTGDTSTLHIASALGTPLVGIYGSTRPGNNAPLFGPHVLLYDDTVPCAPCHKRHCPLAGAQHLRCQRAVTPAQVLAALHSLLKPAHPA